MIDENCGTIVSEEYAVSKLQSRTLLMAGISSTYLTREGERIRFYHQLLQEYFAAVGLRTVGYRSRLKTSSYSHLPGGVRADWLTWPVRSVSPWDEVIIALCGIVDNAEEIVLSVIQNDPSLAAHCVASGVLLDPVIRQKTIASLITLIRKGFPPASAAALALRMLGDTDAAPDLVTVLQDDGNLTYYHDDTSVSQAAAFALAGCDCKIARSGLVDVLHSGRKKVAIRAIRSLGIIGDESTIHPLLSIMWDDSRVGMFFSYSSSYHYEVCLALKQIGKRFPDAVIKAMIDGLHSPEPRVRYGCAWVLESVSDASALHGLLDAFIYDVDGDVKRSADGAIANFHDPAAVPELLEGLRNPQARVREVSARGLKSIADRSALRGLLDALTYDLDASVREQCARALGAIGDVTAVPDLLVGLKDPHARIREASAQGLQLIADNSAVKGLLDAMIYDLNAYVRKQCAEALGIIGDATAISALRKTAVHDLDYSVREAAEKSLSLFNDRHDT